MPKILAREIIVKDCGECSAVSIAGHWFCARKSKLRSIPNQKTLEIPDWCPLDDAVENEDSHE